MIVTISANYDDLCIVTNCNNLVFKYLGYKKQELIGENISKIIPKIIGDNHNNILGSAIKENRLSLSEKQIFPLNSEGYISMFSVKLRLLNNLTNGIQIIGFCSPSKNPNAILMYNKVQGVIYGLSKNDSGLTN